MNLTARKAGWFVMLALAVLMAVVTGQYFLRGKAAYFEYNREFYIAHPVRLFCHVGGGIVGLLIGPFQFWSWFRNHRLRLHRAFGFIYLVATVGFGAVGAFLLAPHSYGGVVTHLGFGGLAFFWVITGVLGFAAISAGGVQRHREWMIRSYATTFAAVMLRLWLPFLLAVGLEFTLAYQIVAWLSWVPNLLFAEFFIAVTRQKKSELAASST